MKYILIIGDGMADNPVQELGGRTPLQFAKKPNMDAIASAGTVGEVLTIPEGMPAGSDTAILSIFGCNPRVCYTGRAPLEAAATGIALESGDAVYRCNMVTLDGDGPFEEKRLVSHSAGSIEGADSDRLVTGLFETQPFKQAAEEAGIAVYPASSFRHLAVQKSAKIDELLLIPPHDHLGELVGGLLPSGGEGAAVLEKLMRLSFDVLEGNAVNSRRRAEGKLPANCIWFWAEGMAASLPDFSEKYGKSGGVVSAVPLCRGIGRLTGLEARVVPGATGLLDTDYEGKVNAALDVLKTKDFVCIHIEAPDECTHDGDLEGKIEAIERIDGRVVAPLVERLRGAPQEFRMLVMSDHKTLIATRGHDGTPVPYILFDSRHDNKTGVTYCEQSASAGELLREGTALMDLLFERF